LIYLYLLATSGILYLFMGIPMGRLTHYYDVFVAAEPKTVWNTYFIHVRGSDYRPGTRVLGYEILSESPLTVRITAKLRFLPMPVNIVSTYDVSEPYTRYKERGGIGSIEIVEEGELVSEPGGTRLQIAINAPRRGLLLPLLARHRVERNMRAPQDVCEDRQT
jgi:hypothetical protein